MGDRSSWTPAFAGVTSGVLYALAFPPFNFSYLAWVSLVPLLLIKPPNRKSSFTSGFITGLTANLIIFWWLWSTFKAAQISIVATFLCWVALASILALYFACFRFFYEWLPNTWFKPLGAGAAWVVLELIRSYILTGFPWALLAHTQAYHPLLLQICSITGALGLSFLIILVNSTIAEFFSRHSGRNRGPERKLLFWIPASAGMTIVFVFGWWRLSHVELEQTSLKVAILQGNIDQYQKWDAAYEKLIKTTYEQLALQAAQEKPDLIVWPESALPGWFPNDPELFKWTTELVKKTNAPNLIGAVSAHNNLEHNSAFLFNPKGHVMAQYDKEHLVPFGEYIPFGNFFKKWVPYLGQLGIFDAGTSNPLFEIADIKIAPTICYEAMFSGLVRREVKRGADVIVNITNDGWFLKTGAPEQHFVTNIFRAVENKRPVIRAANTGISGVIDAYGRVQIKSELMTRMLYFAHVTRTPRTTRYSFSKN